MSNKGKSAMTENFAITPAMRAWADKRCPTLDIDHYLEEFQDFWIGNGRLMKSWEATWRNRMRSIHDGTAYGVPAHKVVKKRPQPVRDAPRSEGDIYWERIDEKRRVVTAMGLHFHKARQMSEQELNAYIAERDPSYFYCGG